jgi:sulfite exporter TauE/SafE
MENLWMMFGMGFLGSLHCVGMCGGLVCALSMTRPKVWWAGLIGYQFGRVTTYMLFGLVVGLFGSSLGAVGGGWILKAFAVLAGGLMLMFGLNFAGWIPDPLQRISVEVNRSVGLAKLARRYAERPSVPGWYAMGMANGLLPCGLLYAALGLALVSSSAVEAMLKMAMFGLGTIPAMMLAPGLVRKLTPVLRGRVLRIAGVLLILLGILTMLRSGDLTHHHSMGQDIVTQCETSS